MSVVTASKGRKGTVLRAALGSMPLSGCGKRLRRMHHGHASKLTCMRHVDHLSNPQSADGGGAVAPPGANGCQGKEADVAERNSISQDPGGSDAAAAPRSDNSYEEGAVGGARSERLQSAGDGGAAATQAMGGKRQR